MSDISDFSSLVDNSEPCNQERDKDGILNDKEKWTGNWVNSTNPEVARALCAGCHILEQCLEYAIAAEEKNFIYGGTTPAERKVIFNARRRRAKKTNTGPVEDSHSEDEAA